MFYSLGFSQQTIENKSAKIDHFIFFDNSEIDIDKDDFNDTIGKTNIEHYIKIRPITFMPLIFDYVAGVERYFTVYAEYEMKISNSSYGVSYNRIYYRTAKHGNVYHLHNNLYSFNFKRYINYHPLRPFQRYIKISASFGEGVHPVYYDYDYYPVRLAVQTYSYGLSLGLGKRWTFKNIYLDYSYGIRFSYRVAPESVMVNDNKYKLTTDFFYYRGYYYRDFLFPGQVFDGQFTIGYKF